MGETHYYRMKKIDRDYPQFKFPKPGLQLYNIPPERAKEELSNK